MTWTLCKIWQNAEIFHTLYVYIFYLMIYNHGTPDTKEAYMIHMFWLLLPTSRPASLSIRNCPNKKIPWFRIKLWSVPWKAFIHLYEGIASQHSNTENSESNLSPLQGWALLGKSLKTLHLVEIMNLLNPEEIIL